MSAIKHGTPVVVTDANGEEHDAVALSSVEVKGHSFPIIWIMLAGHEDSRMPWPVESVREKEQS